MSKPTSVKSYQQPLQDQPVAEGPFSKILNSIRPYLQLARVDRPYGLVYFYVPYLSGLLHAGILLHFSATELLKNGALLLVNSFFLRITVCAWNDIIDAPYDRHVTRTKQRPLARQAISVPSALCVTGGWGLIWVATLQLLNPLCYTYAIFAGFMWILYPFMKRITNLPQVFLSILQAWNVFLGLASTGINTVVPTTVSTITAWKAAGDVQLSGGELYAAGCHFLAYFAWQLVFDTVYGFQDIKDDKNVGVKSTAIMIEAQAKPTLAAVAGIQLLALLGLGYFLEAGAVYYAGAVLGAGAWSAFAIWKVDLDDPPSCAWFFKNGGLMSGLAMLSGLVSECLWKLWL